MTTGRAVPRGQSRGEGVVKVVLVLKMRRHGRQQSERRRKRVRMRHFQSLSSSLGSVTVPPTIQVQAAQLAAKWHNPVDAELRAVYVHT
jgi:hypothetical protein